MIWAWQLATIFLGLLLGIAIVLGFRRRVRRGRMLGELEELREQLHRGRHGELETDRRFHALLSSLPVGVGLLDVDLIYRQVNAALCEMLDVPREQLIGQHVYESLQGSRAPGDFYPGIWAMTTHQPAEAVIDQRRANGTRLLARFTVTPVEDEQGRVVALVQVVERISCSAGRDRTKAERSSP